MNKIAFILIGVSGSGKSTTKRIIHQLCHDRNLKVADFSLDDCRTLMYKIYHPTDGMSEADVYKKAFEYANENSKQFDEFVTLMWQQTLSKSANKAAGSDTHNDVIIIDNTNLTRKSRNRWITGAKGAGYNVIAIQVNTDLQTVIDRQQTRGDKSVPDHVVKAMYMSQQEVQLGTECSFIVNIDGKNDSKENITDRLVYVLDELK